MWKKIFFFARFFFLFFSIKAFCLDILVSDYVKSPLYPKAGQVVGEIGKEYTSPTIEKLGCAITVVLMEPSITPRTHIALESVAANIRPRNRACFLIQTSLCRIRNNSTYAMTNYDAYLELLRQIESSALPLFMACSEKARSELPLWTAPSTSSRRVITSTVLPERGLIIGTGVPMSSLMQILTRC